MIRATAGTIIITIFNVFKFIGEQMKEKNRNATRYLDYQWSEHPAAESILLRNMRIKKSREHCW